MQSEEKKITHVMNKHGVELAELARQNEIPREIFTSFLRNKKRVKKFFNELTNQQKHQDLYTEAAKIGARIVIIENLLVDYGKSFKQAVMAGGPQSLEHIIDVVKGKYKTSRKSKFNETVVLLNVPKRWFGWEKNYAAISEIKEWALLNGLKVTDPYLLFALGEKFPKLDYSISDSSLNICESTGFTEEGFNDNRCSLLWSYDNRSLDLLRCSSELNQYYWIAFRK